MWGSLLVVLNSHFYHQHWNKIKQIWLPKLRIRVYNSHFPQVLVYTCLQAQVWKFNKMRNQEGVLKQNICKSPTKFQLWARTLAWEPSRPSHPPTRARRWRLGWPKVRPHPWCRLTAPSSAQPHLVQVVHSMLGEAVACGAFLKYMSKPSYSSYKRRPPLHIWGCSYTFWRRRRATHIPLASS